MKRTILVAAVVAAVVVGSRARADDGAPAPSPAAPLTVEQRLQELEQRNAVLERKVENDQEAAAAKAKDGASAVAGKDGFQFKSNDGNFTLRITGYVQIDYRDFLDDSDQFTDQFLLRRVRTSIEGTINKYVDFRVLPDFANGGGTNGSSILQDAYVELKYIPTAKVRVGKFKPGVGLERLQSGSSLLFVERALPTNLVPNRGTGVQVGGEFGEGTLAYQLGVYNGAPDATSTETDTNDGKDYTARLWAQPFKRGRWISLTDFGFGVAASVGNQKGTAASAQLPSFRTDGQNVFFAYRSGDTFADGKRTRVVPQAYWYTGPFGVLGEYAISNQEVTRATSTTTSATLRNQAWQVAVSWVVTGEKPSFKGLVPLHPLDPQKGEWGALELTGRYSDLKVDDDAFPRYANAAAAARRAKAWSAGFNWYLSKTVKVTSNYETTIFDGGATRGDRASEKAVLSRVQLVY